MTIIRIRKRKPGFTVIDNQPIDDLSLRWETLGLFTYLMSKPDGWEISTAHLWRQKRGAGRDKVRRMLKELEAAGYFRQERVQRSDGRFDWVKILYETPQPSTENQSMAVQGENDAESPSTENQSMAVQGENDAESPSTGLPSPVQPSPVNQGITTNTELVNTELVITSNNKQVSIVNTKGARVRTREGIVVVADKNFSIQDAFNLAGIKKHTARRIPKHWKKFTGEDLTPEDVLAWHFYREAENLKLPAGKQLRPAFVIANLELGQSADEKFYERAREYLAERAAKSADEQEPQLAPEIPALHRALEDYLPTLAEVGLETLDAIRSEFSTIAQDLHARGVTAKDLADLLLYLTYTNQPIPHPADVADALAQAGAEFQAWRERKAEAEKLWQHIVRQDGLAPSGSAVDRAMRQASPVDLNGALVVMADDGLELHFTRIWPKKAATVLSSAGFPKDLPIQFISQ